MWKILIISIFLSSSFLASGQGNFNALPAKHKQLFEFIPLHEVPLGKLITSDAEKLKLSLSLEILNTINKTSPQDMYCLLKDLTGESISVQHLDIISEMLNRYEYHESGYVPCQASNQNLSTTDLKKISTHLWQNQILKNEAPSGYCRGRAYLTSKILDDLGFKSKMLTMRGNIFGAYKTKSGYKSASYYEHFVNIVEVKENDTIIDYVIDPMFTDGPLPLKDYLELVSLPIFESPAYKIKHQTYADKLAPPTKDESCQYNVKLLEDYKSTIEESLKNPSPHQGHGDKTYKSPLEAKDAYVKTQLDFKP